MADDDVSEMMARMEDIEKRSARFGQPSAGSRLYRKKASDILQKNSIRRTQMALEAGLNPMDGLLLSAEEREEKEELRKRSKEERMAEKKEMRDAACTPGTYGYYKKYKTSITALAPKTTELPQDMERKETMERKEDMERKEVVESGPAFGSVDPLGLSGLTEQSEEKNREERMKTDSGKNWLLNIEPTEASSKHIYIGYCPYCQCNILKGNPSYPLSLKYMKLPYRHIVFGEEEEESVKEMKMKEYDIAMKKYCTEITKIHSRTPSHVFLMEMIAKERKRIEETKAGGTYDPDVFEDEVQKRVYFLMIFGDNYYAKDKDVALERQREKEIYEYNLFIDSEWTRNGAADLPPKDQKIAFKRNYGVSKMGDEERKRMEERKRTEEEKEVKSMRFREKIQSTERETRMEEEKQWKEKMVMEAMQKIPKEEAERRRKEIERRRRLAQENQKLAELREHDKVREMLRLKKIKIKTSETTVCEDVMKSPEREEEKREEFDPSSHGYCHECGVNMKTEQDSRNHASSDRHQARLRYLKYVKDAEEADRLMEERRKKQEEEKRSQQELDRINKEREGKGRKAKVDSIFSSSSSGPSSASKELKQVPKDHKSKPITTEQENYDDIFDPCFNNCSPAYGGYSPAPDVDSSPDDQGEDRIKKLETEEKPKFEPKQDPEREKEVIIPKTLTEFMERLKTENLSISTASKMVSIKNDFL